MTEVTRRASQSGATLLIVLLLVGLTAALAMGFAITVRLHVKATANVVENIRAKALADGGIRLAILKLQSTDAASIDESDADPFIACRSEIGDLAVQIEDEAGKIDVNSASPDLLNGFFRGMGLSELEADNATRRIADAIDSDDSSSDGGAEIEAYESAGLTYGPKNQRFRRVDELAQTPALTSVQFAQMRSHLTVYTALPGVDPRQTSKELADILARGGGADIVQPGGRGDDGPVDLPLSFTTESRGASFRIISQATLPSGARYVAEAVVGITPAVVKIHEWRQGERLISAQSSSTRCREFDLSRVL